MWVPVTLLQLQELVQMYLNPAILICLDIKRIT